MTRLDASPLPPPSPMLRCRQGAASFANAVTTLPAHFANIGEGVTGGGAGMEHFDFNFHLQSRGSLFHVFVLFECVAAPRRLVVIAGVRHPPGCRFGATGSKQDKALGEAALHRRLQIR